MAKAEQGNKVKVHYKGTLEDGTVFDSSYEREPLEFVVGEGKIIPGFEKEVQGMSEEEKKDIHIPADDAYGQYRDDLVAEFPKEKLPEGMDPDIGQQLQMQTNEGQQFVVTVLENKEDSLKLDANHPLAGKDLNFELQMVSIEENDGQTDAEANESKTE